MDAADAQDQVERAKRIRAEKTKLRRLLKDVDRDRLKAVDKLVGNVAFMSVILDDLQTHIALHGCVSEYQNGENQWGTKKSPEAEMYVSLMQRYLPAVKQLVELLPELPKGGPKEGDALMDWVGNRGRP